MNYGQLRLILEEILAKADAAEHDTMPKKVLN